MATVQCVAFRGAAPVSARVRRGSVGRSSAPQAVPSSRPAPSAALARRFGRGGSHQQPHRQQPRQQRLGVVVQADAAGAADWAVPLKMNTTPHARELRNHFYDDAAASVSKAFASDASRLMMRMVIPETNPEMDVFRIGTMLEMIRVIATAAASDGKRVKVCVQGTMGEGVFQGLPLSLSGVRRILDAMDWGDVDEFISKGAVGPDEIDEADYYLIISPQNIVGQTVVPLLEGMCEAAESKGKKVLIINPNLTDIPSAAGVMGVRGRAERIAFAESFQKAYEFRLLYVSGTWYPIMGAFRYAFGGSWDVYKRTGLGKNEAYGVVKSFEEEPTRGQISVRIFRV